MGLVYVLPLTTAVLVAAIGLPEPLRALEVAGGHQRRSTVPPVLSMISHLAV